MAGRQRHPARPTPPGTPGSFQAVRPASLGQLRILRIGIVELELDAHQARVAGTPIHLPHREFQVLHMLMDNAGRIVTRRQLLDTLWGTDHPDIHKTIEVHINRLRRRLRTPGKPEPIRTVRGVGYIFDLPDTDQS
jgi:DNA-binding response OmpR family regulator